MIKKIGFFFKEAFISMNRNRLLTFATLTTVTICLTIVGAALLLTLNLEAFIQKQGDDQEIKVYIVYDYTGEAVSDLGAAIREIAGVERVQYISREQGLRELQEKSLAQGYNLQLLGNNPLPDSFRVKTQSVELVAEVALKIQRLDGVDEVNYGKGIVEKLEDLTDGIRVGSLIVIALLAFGSIFLIATTIRLSIFSRRKEVYLMKLIGASDWFIRWPFFIEGILLGLLGAGLALLLIVSAYEALLGNVQIVLNFMELVDDIAILRPYYLGLLVGGALLGISGTWISLNRFLKI